MAKRLMLYTDRPPELGRHEGYPDQSDIRQAILYPIPVDLPDLEEVGPTTLDLPMTEEGKIVGLWHPEAEQWIPVYYSEGIGDENNKSSHDDILEQARQVRITELPALSHIWHRNDGVLGEDLAKQLSKELGLDVKVLQNNSKHRRRLVPLRSGEE